ncbi:MAG: class I SAM-dependent methyltransferase [candidate division KSB1 bacterium]|nr:class I SAM-dependent methyltransferase [candidate division KSB1 bacterium]
MNNVDRCILCGSTDSSIKFRVDGFIIVKCRGCGLNYLQNPLPVTGDSDTYHTYYESSGRYDYSPDSPQQAVKDLWEINEQRIAMIRGYKSGGKLLDIGSGRGYFLQHAKCTGFDVAGVEISSLAAGFCEREYDIKVHVRNVERGLELDDRYDIITMWHVLEHFMDPGQVLRNVRSRLTENGVFFIEVPNVRSLKFLLSSKPGKWVGGNHPRHHRYFFSGRTLSMLVRKSGFESTEIQRTPYSLGRDSRIKSLSKKLLKTLNLDSFVNIIAK